MTSSGVDGRVAALAAQVGERAGRAAWPGEIAALDLACRAAGALR